MDDAPVWSVWANGATSLRRLFGPAVPQAWFGTLYFRLTATY